MHAPDGDESSEPLPEAQETRAFADKEAARALLTERMLLSALREQDAADAADLARRRAEFLAEASLRFGASLDRELTYAAIAGLELPGLDAWCVVDVVEVGGGIRRIAALHSDDDRRVATRSLIAQWLPTDDVAIGVPAIARARAPLIINDRAAAAAALSAGVRDPATLRVLEELGAASLLIVPVIAHDALLGAITFVNRADAFTYSAEDIRFGEALAARCAQALESARLHAAARAAWAEADAARADAERANRAKSDFLAVMSHELRTPLNAIGGYTELIELGIHGPVTADQAKALARIRQSQLHLLGLINTVLDYSRVEAGALEYAREAVPLGELLGASEALIAPQARAKQLRVQIKDGNAPVVALADREKVQQIVLNLLSNAVKFTEPAGSVTLECARSDEGVVVRVSDTGCGIASEDLDRLFYPFVQLDAKLTRTHDGTGLGLAISRDLARGMGGDLTVESTLGLGSAFTLTLPPA